MQPLQWHDLEHYHWLSTPVWVYDPVERRFVWANHAALALLRIGSVAALRDYPLTDLSADAPATLSRLADEVAAQGLVHLTWVLQAGGQPRPINISAVVVEMPEGRRGVCLEGRPEALERVDAAALRGVEAVLHFSLALVMFDLDGRVLMQNPSAYRAFPQLAQSEDGVVNRFFSLLPNQVEAERVWRAVEENGADQGERLFNARPRPRWYAYSLHRVLDPVSAAPALLLTAQDVSERVLSEQKFRVLFEQSANAMLLYDQATGRVVDCNRAAAQALRLASRRQLVEAAPAQFYPPTQPDGRNSVEKAVELAEHALKRGWHRYEWTFRRSDGGELLVEITLSPVNLGEQSLMLAVWYDLSFRRLIERQLLEARDAAEAANHAKGQFLANMSHEIRTPLNAIVGMTGLLMDTPLTAIQREWLDVVRFSSEGLVELVGDILDFSRIEAGKVALESRVFDLRALAARTAELLRFRAEEKTLKLVINMAADVPRWVEGDEGRLRQVLVNLLGNAVKFTTQGTVTLNLQLLEHGASKVVVQATVIDTGIGIAADKLSAIFDPFTQADDSITRRYGGSGLGLTISHRLIHAMGGKLSVDSELGQGSQFTLIVPFKLAAAPVEEQDALGEGQLEAAPLRILLAEDNLMNQKLALALLGQAGHSVTIAQHGGEAVDLFFAGQYDLVLMDMQMPEMDGIQATGAIRAMEPPGSHTPIVAMTANVMPEDRARCFAAGMDDFMTKPISLPKLHQMLRKVSEARHRQRAEAALVPPKSPPAATTPADGAASGLFDVALGLEACGDSSELLLDLAQLFQEEWPERRRALEAANAAGNTPVMAKLAHTLKGSFGALASHGAIAAAAAVEGQAKAGTLPALEYARLLEAGDGLCRELAAWQATVAAAQPG